MTESSKYRIIAFAVTVAIFAIAIALLFLVRLSFRPADGSQWPPVVDSTQLLFADEYVEIEPLAPVPNTGGRPDDGASAPNPDANDLYNAGAKAEEVSPLTSSTVESPVKVTPKEPQAPAGPSAEELAEQERQRREQQASEEAKNRVGRIGKIAGAKGDGEGSVGEGTGEATKRGSLRGSAGGYGLGGRGVTVSADGIDCPNPGKVTVKIWVNKQGVVTKAEIVPGSTTITDGSVRNACLARARAAKVSPKNDAPDEQIGTITFNFK